MVSHNNAIPNQHFRKDWDKRVRTWFNQAARKQRRRANRASKAAALAPRPLNKLRPVVRGQTVRYNQKLKLGKGFSLQELAEAKISAKKAQTLGISVDHRRINRSAEGLRTNAQRLKEYLAKLVVAKKGEKPAVAQVKSKVVLPFKSYDAPTTVESRPITEAERKRSVFETLRQARASARYIGRVLNPKTEDVGEKK